MNEIELINILNKSRIFVTSWGTSFFKNYIYVSDKCEKIIVMVTPDFMGQYNSHLTRNVLPKKHKNASILYHIVNTDLNNIILSDIM
jgi:capsular polysaccharide biosynthesis protein